MKKNCNCLSPWFWKRNFWFLLQFLCVFFLFDDDLFFHRSYPRCERYQWQFGVLDRSLWTKLRSKESVSKTIKWCWKYRVYCKSVRRIWIPKEYLPPSFIWIWENFKRFGNRRKRIFFVKLWQLLMKVWNIRLFDQSITNLKKWRRNGINISKIWFELLMGQDSHSPTATTNRRNIEILPE